MVFDGANLPQKQQEEATRKKRRQARTYMLSAYYVCSRACAPRPSLIACPPRFTYRMPTTLSLLPAAIRTQACTMQEKRARGVQLLRAGNRAAAQETFQGNMQPMHALPLALTSLLPLCFAQLCTRCYSACLLCSYTLPPRSEQLHAGAVDITPQIAHDLIVELRKEGVEIIVAPYEADAQVS